MVIPSATKPLPLRIDEDRIADFGLNLRTAHRIMDQGSSRHAVPGRFLNSASPIEWLSVGENATEVT